MKEQDCRTWNNNDKSNHIQITQQNILSYVGPGKSENDAASIRTIAPVPPSLGIFYWEMSILNKGRDGHIGIGIGTVHVSLNRLPGWESQSIGWHGDDGFVFVGSGNGTPFGPCYSTGDVVGCGLDFVNGRVFFTRNAVIVGYLPVEVCGPLWFPMAGFRTPGEQVSTNFEGPFEFDLGEYVERQRFLVQSAISKTPLFLYNNTNTAADKLSGCITEEDLKKIVLGWLLYQGYLETSMKFYMTAFEQTYFRKISAAPLVSPSTKELAQQTLSYEELIREISQVKERREIVELAEDGFILSCIDRIRMLDEGILKQNKTLAFRLHTQHFIELVRRYYEVNESSQENGKKEELQTILKEVLDWGSFLAREYPQEPLLNTLFCLVAYKDAGNSCQDGQWALFLLNRNLRSEVAWIANSAVLTSQKKQQNSGLEVLVRQAISVRDTLKQIDGSTAVLNENF